MTTTAETIAANLAKVQEIQTADGRAKQHDLTQQIEAAKYLGRQSTIKRANMGIRFFRFKTRGPHA